MKSPASTRRSGFTLLETVIAIGVLAVLLTAFMYVFGPAMAGIRKSINVQEADRLVTTLEREMVTLREGQDIGAGKTGFDKAFLWIKESTDYSKALMIYQYRGDPSRHREDGTMEPVNVTGGIAGKDFIVQPMARRIDDTLFRKDLAALEGPVFFVKCTQLVYDKDKGLIAGTPGAIADPQDRTKTENPDAYQEAVVAFSAEFHGLPSISEKYLSSNAFKNRFQNAKDPIFTRNLAVRR